MPLAKRRQKYRHDVQTIVEVLAKRAVADHLGQIAVGGGNQADIDVAFVGIADFFDLFRLQRPQQFSLGFHAQVADFVEEQRALVGGLEQPLLRGDGPAERAFHVAEQLAFQQRRGQALQSQAISGWSFRRLRRWIARTNISLPVPLSPVNSTVPSVGATRRARAKTRSIARLSPMIPSKPW